MFTLRWSEDAAGFFDGLTEKEKVQVDRVLLSLATDPFNAPNSKHLTGPLAGLHSVRIRSWRIIYSIPAEPGLVDLLVFNDRKDVYR